MNVQEVQDAFIVFPCTSSPGEDKRGALRRARYYRLNAFDLRVAPGASLRNTFGLGRASASLNHAFRVTHAAGTSVGNIFDFGIAAGPFGFLLCVIHVEIYPFL